MPKNGNTDDDYNGAALLTANLIDHSKTPDAVSDAILEMLISMAAETRINVWHSVNGLSVETLALYSMYDTGAGYHRVRLYGEYEAGRLKRRRFLK